MEQIETESIIDSIGSERNVEYENEINHVYAQIRIDEFEDTTLDFSIEDISNLSDNLLIVMKLMKRLKAIYHHSFLNLY